MGSDYSRTFKRRKRVSFSPQKLARMKPRVSDPLPLFTRIPTPEIASTNITADFTYEFSHFNEDLQVFQNISDEQTIQLLSLRQHWDVGSIRPLAPYLVIDYLDSTPPGNEPPFLTSGLLGELLSFGLDFVGDPGKEPNTI